MVLPKPKVTCIPEVSCFKEWVGGLGHLAQGLLTGKAADTDDQAQNLTGRCEFNTLTRTHGELPAC